MLRSALFPKVTAGDPQPLVDEARRLVKQRLARPRQVEALRREILSATGASISADVLTGFVGQADGRRPRNRNDRRTLLDWANWAVDRPRCQRCAAVQHLCACTAPEPIASGPEPQPAHAPEPEQEPAAQPPRVLPFDSGSSTGRTRVRSVFWADTMRLPQAGPAWTAARVLERLGPRQRGDAAQDPLGSLGRVCTFCACHG